MLPPERPDRIQIAFDDHRLVANAGLLLPVTLAQRLGLSQLVDRHVDLGRTPGRANTGDKMMTLVASALAGGDCIDDADVLRTGGTAGAIGCVVKAPSTLGTFLRSFRWGHVRQLDRVSRELLAIAAGTGDVLMARLRKGRANTARGAAHLLRETVGRVRYAGATGPLTVRADSGFYTHAVVAVCRKAKVRFSITVRQHQSLRQLIEAIPEEDWTPIPIGWTGPPTWLRPPIRLSTPSPTPRRCASSSAGCSPRPAPNWRCSPTIAITPSSPTGRAIPWISRPTTAATPRSRTPSATSSTAWASTTCHRAVFPPILSLPKGAWLAVQSLPRTRYGVIAHNLARWTARIGLGEQLVTTKTLRRRFFSLAGRLTRSARRLTLHLPQGWPWGNQFGSAVARLRTLPLPS